MKIIKKNQLTILVLALMLVTAGYLNYNSNVNTSTEVASMGDATLVSANLSNSINSNVINNEIKNNTIAQNNVEKNTTSNNNKNEVASSVATTEESIETNSQEVNNNQYFSSSKLERETMYSQMLESYQKILESTTTSTKQKEAAQKEIDSINKVKNAIMISENLIKTKGIEDVVIFSNDDSISVIVNKDQINKEDIAQIQSIIAREMNAKIDDIHITNQQ